MQIIELDAKKWKSILDFYNALLGAIGAPEWHGKSPDALVDSMVWGGINTVEPPYTVRISGLSTVPKEVRDGVELAKEMLARGRNYRKRHNGDDAEVAIEIERAPDDHEAKARDAAEVAETARVKYEGPDPKARATVEGLRRKLNSGPIRSDKTDRSSDF